MLLTVLGLVSCVVFAAKLDGQLGIPWWQSLLPLGVVNVLVALVPFTSLGERMKSSLKVAWSTVSFLILTPIVLSALLEAVNVDLNLRLSPQSVFLPQLLGQGVFAAGAIFVIVLKWWEYDWDEASPYAAFWLLCIVPIFFQQLVLVFLFGGSLHWTMLQALAPMTTQLGIIAILSFAASMEFLK
jgi:hypothetical protein